MSNFPNQKQRKSVCMAWGKFNPPTVEHQVLAKNLVAIAKSRNAVPVIFMDKEFNAENPLLFSEKLSWIHVLYPDISPYFNTNVNVVDPVAAAISLAKSGFTDLIIVGGADTVQHTKAEVLSANGNTGKYKFVSVTAVATGPKDPDNSETFVSAAELKQAALDGNIQKFRRGLPDTASDEEINKLMQTIKARAK